MLQPLVEEITDILNRPVGASLTYHVGHLAIDRSRQETGGPNLVAYTRAEREAFNDTAILADRLAGQGRVALVQRRLGEHSYQYIAQRVK